MGSTVGLVYLLLMLCSLGGFAFGGCAGHCCRGRDMNCLTTDWRMDRVYGTCYCDESCGKTRDCCFDYFTECPAQDCAVSDWSFWSGCAKPCQPSMRVRVRHTERQPSNGGEACPALEQKAGCREYRDHTGKTCGAHSGPAFITSMEFAKGRPKHDSYGNPLQPGFCVEFLLESRSPHCSLQSRPHTHWMRYITEGFRVCVACEPPAMSNHSARCHGDGHGTHKEAVLHWQALGSPQCSGTWRRVQRTKHCHCPPQHSFVFI
ncbi:unnamed protein product [Knipowitschia caucasica]|uniref:SMB domain-containing protein n=1 Tax=Knipowitschia caucasica TaxID=637954 RepID=A0AAV2L6V4_KNICA